MSAWSRRHGAPPEGPFALTDEGPHGPVLAAVDAAAAALGLTAGRRLADARAAVPELRCEPADGAAEAELLDRLAGWAERYAPGIDDDATRGAARLLIDIAGAAHLHGGEAGLLVDLAARLKAMKVPARLALADTQGAAWAMARHGADPIALISPGGAATALAPLPVAALRLDDAALILLRRLRLRTIGDVLALPRHGLARRFDAKFGPALVTRLDQALDNLAEPLRPRRPPPVYRADVRCAEPLEATEPVAAVLPDLAARLCAALAVDDKGARHIVLQAWRVDGGVTELEAGLSAPTRDQGHLVRLLTEAGLERLDLGYGVDALRLSAMVAEPLAAAQVRLDRDPATPPDDAADRLIDRLRAKLGPRAVRWSRPRASWLPERADRWVAVRPRGNAEDPPVGPRPILLLEPPEPIDHATALMPDGAPRAFTWRRVRRTVVRAAGPERIAPEWWRGGAERTRDYYVVEDATARRYWLYRDGLFERTERADETELPRWFVHGLFG